MDEPFDQDTYELIAAIDQMGKRLSSVRDAIQALADSPTAENAAALYEQRREIDRLLDEVWMVAGERVGRLRAMNGETLPPGEEAAAAADDDRCPACGQELSEELIDSLLDTPPPPMGGPFSREVACGWCGARLLVTELMDENPDGMFYTSGLSIKAKSGGGKVAGEGI